MNAAACLDAATFQRLLAGRISAAEADAASAHLGGCEQCQRLVRGLPEDTVAAVVRQAQRLPAQNADAARLQALVGRVLQLRSGTSTVSRAAPEQHTVGGALPAAVDPAAALGRYRIVRELGRGGMGTVYEAEDPQLRRRVALKLPQFSGSAEKQALMRQRFLREARAAAAVDHPNVCKIFDVGEQDGRPFVVMAFVNGASMADRLPPGRRVKDRQAVELTVRIAEALLAVHAHGIVHRDLKPANILITRDGNPILTDFGLARVHAESEQLTGEGALLGTPAYMAPEQAVADLGPVTVRTDLYSLAVVLFQMLTGRLPLEGSLPQIVAHHLSRKPAPPPSHFHADVDPALDAILRRAMAYRPEERYPDVRAFLQALHEWLRAAAARAGAAPTPPAPALAAGAQGQPVPAALISTVAAAPVQAGPRRRRAWPIAVALLGVVGCVILAIVLLRDKTKDEWQPDGRHGSRPDLADGGKDKLPANGWKGIDENFQNLKGGEALPAGWKGDAYAVIPDKDQQPCLVVRKATGEHSLTLPPVALRGDFFIEGKYHINQGNQSVTIHLEAAKGSARLPVVMDFAGGVTIADNLRLVAQPYDLWKMTRFRLTREGKVVRVALNGREVAVARLGEAVEYDTVRLVLTAGDVNQGVNGLVKLYSLKIGPLPQ